MLASAYKWYIFRIANALGEEIIPFSVVNVMPSILLQKKMNLELASDILPYFVRKNKKVLWLEKYYCPSDDNLPYCQHILYRWICTKDFYDCVKRKFKGLKIAVDYYKESIEYDIFNEIEDMYIF